MKANEIIILASKEIGVCESPANSNLVKYNDWYYGKPGVSAPWCCTFISYLFKGTDLVKKTASCADMLTWFEQRGQIVTTPQPGDIVFFKYSTNARRTNHIGLVVSVNGKQITTIEGNTSSSMNGSQDNGGIVCKRTRSLNIVAYARPKYEDQTVSNKEIPIEDYPTIEYGDRGLWVVLMQQKLFEKGFFQTKKDIDGIFMSRSRNALIAFQGMNNLTKDAICGPKTWAKLCS